MTLLPDSAAVEGGELTSAGIAPSELAERFGTPLLVYCEETLRAQARAYREAAPDALVVYRTKAFPNVALLRLLADGGRRRRRLDARRARLRAQARASRASGSSSTGTTRATRSCAPPRRPARVRRARRARRDRRARPRPACGACSCASRPGVEADTHDGDPHRATTARSSASPPDAGARRRSSAARARARGRRRCTCTSARSCSTSRGRARAIDWLGAFAADVPRRARLGAGGRRPRRRARHPVPRGRARAGDRRLRPARCSRGSRDAWQLTACAAELDPRARPLARRPRRASRSTASASVKQRGGATTYVAIDGGMSDNPRPQLYGARYEALLANRADELADGDYRVAGKHCESGDVLIESVRAARAAPRRPARRARDGRLHALDLLELQRLPRPAAVLVADGEARADPPPRDARRPARARARAATRPARLSACQSG